MVRERMCLNDRISICLSIFSQAYVSMLSLQVRACLATNPPCELAC